MLQSVFPVNGTTPTDAVDVDDGEVAEEEHGDRHDEAGDLSEQGSDHGCGGSGGAPWSRSL
jgi:hypothetical protein